jgi:hypothetical protein
VRFPKLLRGCWVVAALLSSSGLAPTRAETSDEDIKVWIEDSKLHGSYTTTVPLGDSIISIPLHSISSLFVEGTSAAADITVEADLSYLQEKIATILEDALGRSPRCGDRLHLHDVALSPDGDSALLEADADYEKRVCSTLQGVPQIRCEPNPIEIHVPTPVCEDTWIYGPFGMKTKGIPNCHTEDRVNKFDGPPRCVSYPGPVEIVNTLLFAQSGHGGISFTPILVDEHTVTLDATVTDARLDGLAQALVDLLGIDLKGMAQSQLNKAIENLDLQLAIPEEFQPHWTIKDVRFREGDGGKLLLVATSHTTISATELAALCQSTSLDCPDK